MRLGTLHIASEAIEAFCQRWSVTELAVFGSVLGDAFSDESDIDLLVTFAPTARPSLFDLSAMQQELEEIIGRKVDLMTKKSVEQSRNPLRRRAILENAHAIYTAKVA